MVVATLCDSQGPACYDKDGWQCECSGNPIPSHTDTWPDPATLKGCYIVFCPHCGHAAPWNCQKVAITVLCVPCKSPFSVVPLATSK